MVTITTWYRYINATFGLYVFQIVFISVPSCDGNHYVDISNDITIFSALLTVQAPWICERTLPILTITSQITTA